MADDRTIRRTVISVIVFAVIVLGLACLGHTAAFQSVVLLLCGWILYLGRVLPHVRFSPSGWFTFAVCLALFATGLHLVVSRQIRSARASRSESEPAWSAASTARLIGLILVLFIAGIAIVGVVHQLAWLAASPEPLVTSGREAATRTQSRNNLKQIALAAHNYHDVWQAFPAGGTFSRTGVPMHSWATHLLPWLDEAQLYRQIDLDQPWRAQRHAEQFQTVVSPLSNPGLRHLHGGMSHESTPDGYAAAHYAGNSRVLRAGEPTSLDQIADGATHTILAGEVISEFRAWGDPVNLRDPAKGIGANSHQFCGPWQQSSAERLVNFVMCDGSVRTVSGEIDQDVLKAISTPDGGENVLQTDF